MTLPVETIHFEVSAGPLRGPENKRNRFTDEQIIGILGATRRGTPVSELCRKHGISDATIYKWRAKFGA